MSNYTVTESDIRMLRRITGEYPAETSSYTDEELTDALEARSGDIHAAAYDVWNYKAAAAAALFDWSADGGDYKQAALYDRCKANAEAEWKQSGLCAFVIDPTLKEVENDL